MITPFATGSEPVVPVFVLSSVELLIRMVFRPSIPAICEPLAVPVTPETSISPVEYSSGEPLPAVFSVESVTETDPPPRSVASDALWSPLVEIVIALAMIEPP